MCGLSGKGDTRWGSGVGRGPKRQGTNFSVYSFPGPRITGLIFECRQNIWEVNKSLPNTWIKEFNFLRATILAHWMLYGNCSFQGLNCVPLYPVSLWFVKGPGMLAGHSRELLGTWSAEGKVWVLWGEIQSMNGNSGLFFDPFGSATSIRPATYIHVKKTKGKR